MLFIGLIAFLSFVDFSKSALQVTDIKFNEYNEKGKYLQYNYDPNYIRTWCSVKNNFTIILHGWSQWLSTTVFAQPLIQSFLKERRGIVVFVEYSGFTMDYGTLATPTYFDQISSAITNYISKLLDCGFQSRNGWLWGFSYGARLAIDIGIRLGYQNRGVNRVDAVEPAGPGFDGSPTLKRDMKTAATYVNCYHCTQSFGTTQRTNTCNQNWVMGYCGISQPGANATYGFQDHGMCANYYTYAFNNDFTSQNNPRGCQTSGMQLGPTGVNMGPRQNNYEKNARGVFYVDTGTYPPYTLQSAKSKFKMG